VSDNGHRFREQRASETHWITGNAPCREFALEERLVTDRSHVDAPRQQRRSRGNREDVVSSTSEGALLEVHRSVPSNVSGTDLQCSRHGQSRLSGCLRIHRTSPHCCRHPPASRAAGGAFRFVYGDLVAYSARSSPSAGGSLVANDPVSVPRTVMRPTRFDSTPHTQQEGMRVFGVAVLDRPRSSGCWADLLHLSILQFNLRLVHRSGSPYVHHTIPSSAPSVMGSLQRSCRGHGLEHSLFLKATSGDRFAKARPGTRMREHFAFDPTVFR
jgi:hypothetical protein